MTTGEYNMVEFNVICGYCMAKVVDVTVRRGVCPLCEHHVDDYMQGTELMGVF